MTTQTREPLDFKGLKLEQVIDESPYTKSITFRATYEGQTAVVRLEKTPFDDQQTRQPFETTQQADTNSDEIKSERNLINDIYSRYKLVLPSKSGVNDLKAIIITPANETVLAKYSRCETELFTETSQLYHKTVEPFIRSMLDHDKDYNQWVYNILEGRSEVDHVLHNDTDPDSGFILLPSLKSSGDEKDFHILAICHRRDIRSLRDLNEKHLPLLKNILESGSAVIKQKFTNIKGQLRVYIHYHPTFYHFHVHFQIVDASEYKSSDRDNLLATVINNITLVPNYYNLSTLTYPISKGSKLFEILSKSTNN